MPVLVASFRAPGHAWPVENVSPDSPARVDAALAGLAAACAAPTALPPGSWAPAPRAALEAVHDGAYLDWLEAASAAAKAGVQGAVKVADSDDEVEFTYATPSTAADAVTAAGACLEVTRRVLASPSPLLGLALVRPPGHHAGRGRPTAPSGFCFLNSVAVAAAAARRAGVDRVAILDIDVHVGDGTASIFAGDPSVLVLDVHEAGVWPGGGGVSERGSGEGDGATINVPLPPGAGDAAAAAVAARVVAPALARFQPALVIVSLGLDAHAADPLGGLAWTGEAYRFLGAAAASAARAHASGKLVAVLEGGYSAAGIADGVAGFVRGVERGVAEGAPAGTPPVDAEAAVAAVVAEHGLL